jgi:ABC-type sugar transport system permease subunit
MFKKMPGAGFFRVVLFMPSIISAAPISLIYKFLMLKVIGHPGNGVYGLFNANFFDDAHMYGTMMTFSLLIGFGTSVLMYTNKMDSIAPEIIESAHLDGANGIKEFWYIVLPQAFSLIQVFLVTNFAGAFSAQYNAFTLFDPYKAIPEITSLGFLLWNGVRSAGMNMWKLGPYAALGLLLTCVVAPLTFLLRWFFKKYGWKEE